ncbi:MULTISPECIES: LytTR family DNA-binding domain-containing protein [unclassified Spirosoma]|uniref:LytR/AlgR family response regulator transcription factor n=1 Tax=unclassified Spirosoma TaxID=2621999 RepID=UPI000964BFD9|nr:MULTISPECIES: LytTR family DNA-binding domain-containing protein [unclassified Spirosoma]MBN8822770.1 response regulator transcription factor [Spirosoma sp.]OJW79980.1 MAG: DNA-binding response regulator [Spirosoma sp. 48-14]
MPNPLRCLLIDDEQAAHYVLQHYIGQVDQLTLVGNCYDALEAINFLHRHPVDLLFLDINMPQINGLQLLQTLANPPRVILTTAYSEFALESYDYGVVDYLLKPIEFPRFLKAIDKVITVEGEKQSVQLQAVPEQSLMVKVDADWVRIAYSSLEYIQSWGNYVKLFTAQQVYVTSMTMTEVERRLPSDQFIRVHKSYLVPLAKIHRMSGNEVFIGETALPVGLTYRRELVERLKA